MEALGLDPINGRLLAIGFSMGGWDDPEQHVDAVWALDFENGRWIEVVTPSAP